VPPSPGSLPPVPEPPVPPPLLLALTVVPLLETVELPLLETAVLPLLETAVLPLVLPLVLVVKPLELALALFEPPVPAVPVDPFVDKPPPPVVDPADLVEPE
jgi:hypothetical protein